MSNASAPFCLEPPLPANELNHLLLSAGSSLGELGLNNGKIETCLTAARLVTDEEYASTKTTR